MRENYHKSDLAAQLCAHQLARELEEYDRWGRIDRWLVGVWCALLLISFSYVLWDLWPLSFTLAQRP